MKNKGVSVFLCALMLLVLSLAGCGGDSSTPEPAITVLLNGVVEDGPIEDAKISLRDKENNILVMSNIVTDVNGAFSLQVPAETVFADLSVVAVDGRDRATGVDFTGLEMRTPLALFTPDVTAIVISPLTTLVAELHEQGLALTAAQDRLRDWLALPAAMNLAARPSTSLDLQRRALLLTKIARELDSTQPLTRIGTEIFTRNAALFAGDGSCNGEVLLALGLDAAAQEQVVQLQLSLTAASTVEAATFIYKREELMGFLAANVREMLTDSASFDPLNVNYRENLRLLTETTLQAAGSEVITLGGAIPQRIARYVLFTYQLRTWESLTLDPVVFAEKLALLANDLWIAELARSRSLYSVVSPLLLTELPGNDNQQRLAYFYGSDLSPYFQAEQLIGQVFDDAINDAVLLKIVEGKANAGLIDETRTIIATQIVQSEAKAHAYRALADALIKYNRLEEARSALDLARDLYRQVIAAKGVASASSTDVNNLLQTSFSYGDAGDLVNAQTLLNDIADIATALSSDAIVYGRLITGIKNVADDYIAASDLEAATSLVESMDYYSGLTPIYKSTYQLRVYNWSESAKRYAELGNRAKVLEVHFKIEAQRDADAATATATWSYIPDLVESLYRVGATNEALALAESIPRDSTYLSKAYKLVATYEALQGNLLTAFSIVDDPGYVTKDEDRIELLTYFTESRPYIARMLIDNGSFSEARVALEKAEVLLAGMTQSNNLARISNGYVKVAELYALMGEPADVVKAAALLKSAQDAIIDDVYVVAVMADIALGYNNLKQTDVALTLLDRAKALADENPTFFRANTTSNLGAEEYASQLYEKLIKSYEQLGDKSRVRTATQLLLAWTQQIHTTGKVDDKLAVKECTYLLRAVLYLERAGYHDEAMHALGLAKELTVGRLENGVMVYDIVVLKDRLKSCLSVITTYAAVHEYELGLSLALSLSLTTERNQAIQTLASAYIDRDDFPENAVASIDNDGDDQPDFFHPLASAEEIASSGLLLDDDSDGDGIADSSDLRPLFAD